MTVAVPSASEFAALAGRVWVLEHKPDPRPPWVGVFVGNQYGASNYPALFDTAYVDLGHLSYVRCFDSTLKTPSTARFNQFSGVRVHYSAKPIGGDRAAFIAGEQATAYRALVSALPVGARFSFWHEPEDDMSGAEFLALTARARDDLKAVRPDVEFCYAAMSYQWATNSKGNTGDASGWLAAAKLCDSVAVDVYADSWSYNTLEDDAGFQAWLSRIAQPSGLPWGIAERGIDDHAGEASRMSILSADIRYVLGSACTYFQYWDADWERNGVTYGYALKGDREKALYRAFAAQGRCR